MADAAFLAVERHYDYGGRRARGAVAEARQVEEQGGKDWRALALFTDGAPHHSDCFLLTGFVGFVARLYRYQGMS